MKLVVSRRGEVKCLYSEHLDLRRLGKLHVRRASTIEYQDDGWYAFILDGPTLGPFPQRSDALGAEIAWLEQHRL